jgi:hypothetical protein
MWVINGILVGLIAGICMGMASEAGFRLGWIKANLIHIDGSFATRFLRIKDTMTVRYVLGILFHCLMGAVFGLAYAALSVFLKFDPRMIIYLVPYIFILWLIMLFFALPVAGQGLMGRKGGRFVWLEQLAVHIVFGIYLWLALSVIVI